MGIIGVALCWIMCSKFVYEHGCLTWAPQNSKADIAMTEIIKELDAEDELYYYIVEDMRQADYLQFLLKEETIHCFSNPDEIKRFSDEKYILTINNTAIAEQLMNCGYEYLANTAYVTLWQKK